jgi:hypothetical protein
MSASPKDDPADVAGERLVALMPGTVGVVARSLTTKALGRGRPLPADSVKAKMHGQMAEPGCGDQ